MNLTRLYLLIVGAGFAALGAAYLLAPAELARQTGFVLFTPLSVVEVQGFYGGQMLGIGAALLLALRKPWLVVPGLVLIAATLGGTALGRLYGMATGGDWPTLMLGLFALEMVSAVVALYLLGRARSTPES